MHGLERLEALLDARLPLVCGEDLGGGEVAIVGQQRIHAVALLIVGDGLRIQRGGQAPLEIAQPLGGGRQVRLSPMGLAQRQQRPAARRGPYYEWARMRAGKPTHRYVSEQQAQVLRQAIDNYRLVMKLLRDWEENTERLIDAEPPDQP